MGRVEHVPRDIAVNDPTDDAEGHRYNAHYRSPNDARPEGPSKIRVASGTSGNQPGPQCQPCAPAETLQKTGITVHEGDPLRIMKRVALAFFVDP